MGEAKRRRENQQAARKAVEADMLNAVRQTKAIGRTDIAAFDDDTSKYGDGDRLLINIVIGQRGELTADHAKRAADMWRKATTEHPKAFFCPVIPGYDEDPRELWEFEEVRDYIRQWAKLAGITSPAAVKVETAGYNFIALLAACGCEGFEHFVPTMDGQPIKPTTEQ
jgi:hypothetical protein